jgi:hypothetical protein
LSKVAQELVATTFESVAISRARNLGLDVKRALGYKIIKENGEQDTKTVELTSVKKRVQDLYEKAHLENFRLGSGWLKGYLKDQSEKMMVDLSQLAKSE